VYSSVNRNPEKPPFLAQKHAFLASFERKEALLGAVFYDRIFASAGSPKSLAFGNQGDPETPASFAGAPYLL
jgi:hypothetical protein